MKDRGHFDLPAHMQRVNGQIISASYVSITCSVILGEVQKLFKPSPLVCKQFSRLSLEQKSSH